MRSARIGPAVWLVAITVAGTVIAVAGIGLVTYAGRISQLEKTVDEIDTSEIPIHSRQFARFEGELQSLDSDLKSALLSPEKHKAVSKKLGQLQERISQLQERVRLVSADRVGKAEAGVSEVTSRVAALEERMRARGSGPDSATSVRIDTAVESAGAAHERARVLGGRVARLESSLASKPWAEVLDSLSQEIARLRAAGGPVEPSADSPAAVVRLSARVAELERRLGAPNVGGTTFGAKPGAVPYSGPTKVVQSVTVDGVRIDILKATAQTKSCILMATMTSLNGDATVGICVPEQRPRKGEGSRVILSTGDEINRGSVSVGGRGSEYPGYYVDVHLLEGVPIKFWIEYHGVFKPPVVLRLVQIGLKINRRTSAAFLRNITAR